MSYAPPGVGARTMSTRPGARARTPPPRSSSFMATSTLLAPDVRPAERRRAPHQRQGDVAEARRAHRGAQPADLALAEAQRCVRHGRPGQPQSAQAAVGLAPVVQARDRLLADVAPLGEAHRALVEPGLLGDDALVELVSVARAAGLHAAHLGG